MADPSISGDAQALKQCDTCGVFKPLGDFALVGSWLFPTARHDWCKQCWREVRAGWRKTEREKVRAQEKAEREHLRAQRRAEREAAELRRPALERRRAELRADPENYRKMLAKGRVCSAVRDGRLTRAPCERCGGTEDIEGHHPDYSKPLEVEWLCRACHRALHLAERTGRRKRPARS